MPSNTGTAPSSNYIRIDLVNDLTSGSSLKDWTRAMLRALLQQAGVGVQSDVRREGKALTCTITVS